MSRTRKWMGAALVSIATAGLFAVPSGPAAADDGRLTIKPAVLQVTDEQPGGQIQLARWRGRYYGGYVRGPGVGVYVAPRYYAPRYYAPRYYTPRYYTPRYYSPYYYGYSYPSYGYSYSYPSYSYGYYTPYSYGYSYGW